MGTKAPKIPISSACLSSISRVVSIGVFFSQIFCFRTMEFLMERSLVSKQTYKPHTLVGPTVARPIQDPLAVLSLGNRLCIICGQDQSYGWDRAGP